MYDFSPYAGLSSQSDLIPVRTLLWVWTNLRELKVSKSGGRYMDFEFTVDDGQPYAGHRLWDMVCDPHDESNNETWRQMAYVGIPRMLECGRNASPNNQAGYQCSDDYRELDQIRVAIRVGIEVGEGNYVGNDKNRVAEFLTPNPQSKSGNKDFLKLLAGEHEPPVQPGSRPAPRAAASTSFGNVQPTLPMSGVATGGFGTTPAAQPAQAAGFGNGPVAAAQPVQAQQQPAQRPAAANNGGWPTQPAAQGQPQPGARNVVDRPAWMVEAERK